MVQLIIWIAIFAAGIFTGYTYETEIAAFLLAIR